MATSARCCGEIGLVRNSSPAPDHGAQLAVEILLDGEEHDGQAHERRVLADYLRELIPRAVGQVHVHQHQLRIEVVQGFDQPERIGHHMGAHAGVPQDRGIKIRLLDRILHDQDPVRLGRGRVQQRIEAIHQRADAHRLRKKRVTAGARRLQARLHVVGVREEDQRRVDRLAVAGSRFAPGVIGKLEVGDERAGHFAREGVRQLFHRVELEDRVAEALQLLAEARGGPGIVFHEVDQAGSQVALRCRLGHAGDGQHVVRNLRCREELCQQVAAGVCDGRIQPASDQASDEGFQFPGGFGDRGEAEGLR